MVVAPPAADMRRHTCTICAQVAFTSKPRRCVGVNPHAYRIKRKCLKLPKTAVQNLAFVNNLKMRSITLTKDNEYFLD